MADHDCNLYLYTIPSSTILENRKLFYALKRESDERTQTWLKRIQWHINRCAFPKIIEFLLIDKFMCDLNFNELEFTRRIETWTLSQLYEYFVDEQFADGLMIDSSQEKPTEVYEMDPLSLDPSMDIIDRNMWTTSNEPEIDGIDEMLIGDMKCEVVSIQK